MQQDTKEEPVAIFRFPDRFIYGEVVLFSLVSALLIFAWIPALISFFSYGSVVASAMRAALFLNITAIALILLFFFIKGEIRATQFLVGDATITKKTSTKVTKIPFAAVTGVSLLRYPFGGGVVSIESRDVTMIIPLLVQPVGLLVKRLELLSSNSGSCTVEPGVWKKIHATARLSKLVAEQSGRFFGPMLTLCITMLPLHIFTGAFFWDMSVISLAVWTILGPLFPLAGYAAADLFIRYATSKKPPETSTAALHSAAEVIFVRVGYITLCCYCMAAIIYKTIAI